MVTELLSSCLEVLTESSCGIIVLNQQISRHQSHLQCVCVFLCARLSAAPQLTDSWKLVLLAKWMLH